uniref:Uncharacterized protein n=2 Tax=Ovis aries TaxID=9940 RepID=A0AC11C1U9_SHEEP
MGSRLDQKESQSWRGPERQDEPSGGTGQPSSLEAMTEARRLPPPLPPRLDWFVQTQVDQLTCEGVPEWFHGAISREDAENLLESQPPGSFLIRPFTWQLPGLPRDSVVTNPPAGARDARDTVSIPVWEDPICRGAAKPVCHSYAVEPRSCNY